MKTTILKISTISFFLLFLFFYVSFKANDKPISEVLGMNSNKIDTSKVNFITIGELRVLDSLVQDSLERGGHIKAEIEKAKTAGSRASSSKTFMAFTPEDFDGPKLPGIREDIIKHFSDNVDLDINQLKRITTSANEDWKLVKVSKSSSVASQDRNSSTNPEDIARINALVTDSINTIDPSYEIRYYGQRASSSKFKIPLTWEDFHRVKKDVELVSYFRLLHPDSKLNAIEILDSLMPVFPQENIINR